MTKRTCSYDECERPIQSRWLCATHYSNWYRANRAKTKTCEWCGDTFETARPEQRYCGLSCGGKFQNSKLAESEGWKRYQETRQANKKPTPPRRTQEEMQAIWRARRSPMRAAFEDGNWEAFHEALRQRCTITPTGCWEWQGKRTSSGKAPYPQVVWGGRQHQVHRLSVEAKHGLPLGSQAAHHICANTMCVNPHHLEAVTHQENIAEMMARGAYEARIRELEEALQECSPKHPLLNRIRYGA